MKRSVFDGLWLRLRLLRITIINSWQIETAYFGDAWSNVLSTVAYTLTYLVFVSVIYANVHSVAGFDHNQMLFLVFINQLSFYSLHSWSFNNVEDMVISVNDGSFDLLLTKPLPALFYTTFRTISSLTIIRDGVPALAFVALAINWSAISIAPLDLVLGIIAFVAGQIAINGFIFILGLPVFWFGQAADLLSLSYPFMSNTLPYGGVERRLRLFLTLAIPALAPASLVTAILLHKMDPWLGVELALAAAAIFSILKQLSWKRALLSYTSASS